MKFPVGEKKKSEILGCPAEEPSSGGAVRGGSGPGVPEEGALRRRRGGSSGEAQKS